MTVNRQETKYGNFISKKMHIKTLTFPQVGKKMYQALVRLP